MAVPTEERAPDAIEGLGIRGAGPDTAGCDNVRMTFDPRRMEDYSGTSIARAQGHVAEPWQQTPTQFMNRPDVAVHARLFPKGEEKFQTHVTDDMEEGLHAGTEQAAIERVNNMRPNRSFLTHRVEDAGFTPAAHYGTVNPRNMENTPHDLAPDEGVFGDFNTRPKGVYYENEAEDVGSISVAMPAGNRAVEGPSRLSHDTPGFKTWRQHVTDALADPGRAHTVPHHVRAIYEASGGAEGGHATYPTALKPKAEKSSLGPGEVEQRPLPVFEGSYQGTTSAWTSPNDAYDPNIRGERVIIGKPDPVYHKNVANHLARQMQERNERVPNALKLAAGAHDDTKRIF